MPRIRLGRSLPRPAEPSGAPPRAAGADGPPPDPAGRPALLITPAETAGLLGVTAKVLERWRGTGEGPAFVRLTSKTIRYRSEDLDAFVAARVRASTAAA
jgi:hypothetical protein